MESIKYQYEIEFTLPGGTTKKVTLEGTSPEDALNELFKVVRAKTTIHRLNKPKNDHNDIADLGNQFFDMFKGKKP